MKLSEEKLRKLKLIVFDLDGTLLNEYGEIGKDTIKLVGELRKKGMRFSFATGRLHSAIIMHAETLGLESPLISLDGSYIKDSKNGSIIFESYIPEKYVERAEKMADRFLLKIALCQGDAIYYTEENALIPQLLEKYGARFEEVSSYSEVPTNTLEIVITGDYKDSVKHVEDKMTFPYSWGLSTQFYKSHSHSGIYYLEIRKKGVSKGTGLKRLCRHLGIKKTETAVLGDWYNDRSLFKTKALKIAVANAVPEIKRMADFITTRTNNEDATAEFLEMVLKAKK